MVAGINFLNEIGMMMMESGPKAKAQLAENNDVSELLRS